MRMHISACSIMRKRRFGSKQKGICSRFLLFYFTLRFSWLFAFSGFDFPTRLPVDFFSPCRQPPEARYTSYLKTLQTAPYLEVLYLDSEQYRIGFFIQLRTNFHHLGMTLTECLPLLGTDVLLIGVIATQQPRGTDEPQQPTVFYCTRGVEILKYIGIVREEHIIYQSMSRQRLSSLERMQCHYIQRITFHSRHIKEIIGYVVSVRTEAVFVIRFIFT